VFCLFVQLSSFWEMPDPKSHTCLSSTAITAALGPSDGVTRCLMAGAAVFLGGNRTDDVEAIPTFLETS
jgi:hypothetical protein